MGISCLDLLERKNADISVYKVRIKDGLDAVVVTKDGITAMIMSVEEAKVLKKKLGEVVG